MEPVDTWNTEMLSMEAPVAAPKVGFALADNQTEILSTTPRVPPPPLAGGSAERTSIDDTIDRDLAAAMAQLSAAHEFGGERDPELEFSGAVYTGCCTKPDDFDLNSCLLNMMG